MMTLDEFRASKTNEIPADILEEVDLPKGATPYLYGGDFLIHEHEGKFFVHAWWFSPVAYDTLDKAEEKLYPWYQELN